MKEGLSKSETRFLTLDWNDIKEAVISLADKITSSGINIQVIVGIFRGGWVPARMLADLLDVREVGGLEIKFYRGIEDRRERPIVTQPLTISVKDKNVLIVDDVADTGKSLQTAINALNLFGAKSVRTAVLYVKPWSMSEPDYYYGKTDKWIIFPWEVREVIEELVLAEYRVFPRTKEELQKVATEISQKTGLERNLVTRVLEIIAKQRG